MGIRRCHQDQGGAGKAVVYKRMHVAKMPSYSASDIIHTQSSKTNSKLSMKAATNLIGSSQPSSARVSNVGGAGGPQGL